MIVRGFSFVIPIIDRLSFWESYLSKRRWMQQVVVESDHLPDQYAF